MNVFEEEQLVEFEAQIRDGIGKKSGEFMAVLQRTRWEDVAETRKKMTIDQISNDVSRMGAHSREKWEKVNDRNPSVYAIVFHLSGECERRRIHNNFKGQLRAMRKTRNAIRSRGVHLSERNVLGFRRGDGIADDDVVGNPR